MLILLLSTSAFCATPSTPFDDPVIGFSAALVPLLTSFEKASIETTLRGFIARGDSFPGFENQPEREPSEYGLYLNVAVSEDVKKFSDHREQKGGLTHRLVEILAPKQGQQSLLINLIYGPLVEPEIVRAIDTCISRIAKLQRAAKR